MQKITVAIVDDHPLIRYALRKVLENEPDIEIVGEAGNGCEAINVVNKLKPKVVIMDISLPKMNGLLATKQIKKMHPNVAILVLTIHDDKESISGIIKAGATGYITKKIFDKEVALAIREVAYGKFIFSPEIGSQLITDSFQSSTDQPSKDNIYMLSRREQEILQFNAKSMSIKEIAERLQLAIGTVKAYTADLYAKLGVNSRTEAVIKGLKSGLLSIDDLD